MYNTTKGHASRAHAKIAGMPMPVCSEWIPFPSRAKKRPLCNLPTHPLPVATRPLPCNVAGFGIPFSNKKGTIFSHRETCPLLGSAGNQHCIVWGCGGAVRRGWRGRFFARDGLGCDGVALLSLCACVRMLCGAWLVLSLLGTACTNMGRVVLYILSSTLRYYLLSTPIGPIVALGW